MRRFDKYVTRRLDRKLLNVSCKYFDNTRGMYTGRRGFVIGNGPSLRIEDLNRLQGEICLAANKIYLAFNQTSWRPQFLTVADPLLLIKIHNIIHRYFRAIHIPEYVMHVGCKCKLYVYRHLGNPNHPDAAYFSSNLGQGAFGGHTVTYDNLQLAAHLGLNPIYIIGCDHYYGGEVDVKPDCPVHAGDVQNHFIDGYRQPGELVNPAPIAEMQLAYQCASAFCEQSGLKIFNATRGGFLDVFPRADFDSLFGGDGNETQNESTQASNSL